MIYSFGNIFILCSRKYIKRYVRYNKYENFNEEKDVYRCIDVYNAPIGT